MSSTSPVSASVTADSLEIPYLRRGSGTPVVVLTRTEGRFDLPDALGRRHRVYEPSLDSPVVEQEFARWLRALLDGLGLESIALVADATYALRALAFALTDPLRVDRLVLLSDAPLHQDVTNGLGAERLARSERSFLLTMRVGDDDETVAPRILAFLSDAHEQPGDVPA